MLKFMFVKLESHSQSHFYFKMTKTWFYTSCVLTVHFCKDFLPAMNIHITEHFVNNQLLHCQLVH